MRNPDQLTLPEVPDLTRDQVLEGQINELQGLLEGVLALLKQVSTRLVRVETRMTAFINDNQPT